MPDMPLPSDEWTDPLTELAILRKAVRLLQDVAAMTCDDEQRIAAQVRNVLRTGRRLPPSPALAPPPDWHFADLLDASTPPGADFSVAQRVAALGYTLTAPQAQALVPRLGRLLREHWRQQFAGEPRHEQGEDWYGEEDACWIDQVIHGYLGQFPRLARQTHEGR